jgi:DNA-binding PadR family transcriptional regulator
VSLKPSSYVVLSFVRTGVSTGYAIRSAIEDMRMKEFWATTFAQIYPELAHLEREGYIAGRDDPHGDRHRIAYTITEKGEAAIDDWVRSDDVPSLEVRDEGLLRLACSDVLPGEEVAALIRRLRNRAEAAAREFRDYNIPMAQAARDAGFRAPLMISRMGEEFHAWSADWYRRLEDEVRAELDGPPAPPA